jgi:hypothetical protein
MLGVNILDVEGSGLHSCLLNVEFSAAGAHAPAAAVFWGRKSLCVFATGKRFLNFA